MALSLYSLNVTINICFSVIQFFKEVFFKVVLKTTYDGSCLESIGEFIPSTRPYIR